jgi:hypothetical protein
MGMSLGAGYQLQMAAPPFREASTEQRLKAHNVGHNDLRPRVNYGK